MGPGSSRSFPGSRILGLKLKKVNVNKCIFLLKDRVDISSY